MLLDIYYNIITMHGPMNCTFHITKMFVISTVAVISNLYVDVCALSCNSYFFRVPLRATFGK
jgi:hypothetical protein